MATRRSTFKQQKQRNRTRIVSKKNKKSSRAKSNNTPPEEKKEKTRFQFCLLPPTTRRKKKEKSHGNKKPNVTRASLSLKGRNLYTEHSKVDWLHLLLCRAHILYSSFFHGHHGNGIRVYLLQVSAWISLTGSSCSSEWIQSLPFFAVVFWLIRITKSIWMTGKHLKRSTRPFFSVSIRYLSKICFAHIHKIQIFFFFHSMIILVPRKKFT